MIRRRIQTEQMVQMAEAAAVRKPGRRMPLRMLCLSWGKCPLMRSRAEVLSIRN
ncbi:hypothetical protein D3C87_2057020 [compost metagenome]